MLKPRMLLLLKHEVPEYIFVHGKMIDLIFKLLSFVQSFQIILQILHTFLPCQSKFSVVEEALKFQLVDSLSFCIGDDTL